MEVEKVAVLMYNTGVVNRKIDRGATLIAHGLATTFLGGSYMDHSTLPLFAFKTCTSCNQSKPLAEFHKQGNGLRPTCKACTNEQNRATYQKNHDEHLEAKRRYRSEHPEARHETVRAYDQRHAEKRKAHVAVKLAIYAGKLAPASERTCDRCGAPAAMYHHHSYEEQYRLDVVPLCRICHGKEHRAYD